MNTMIYNQFFVFFLCFFYNKNKYLKMKINTLFLQMILKTLIENSVFIILNSTLYNWSLSRFNSILRYTFLLKCKDYLFTINTVLTMHYIVQILVHKMEQLSVCLLVNCINTIRLNGLNFCLEMAYILVTS